MQSRKRLPSRTTGFGDFREKQKKAKMSCWFVFQLPKGEQIIKFVFGALPFDIFSYLITH